MHIVRCSVQEDFLHLPELVPGNSSFKRIVSVGRLCPEKGALLLIEAASALVDQGVAFQLELIGDGPLRHELETAIKERGLESIVTLAGWKPTPYIRTAISNAHLFVLPSFAEGLPVVLMEALALECPVVTTAIAGHGELVSHGENGWLVPPGDTASLAATIAAACEMGADQLQTMGRAGREQVLRLHHPHRQTDQLLQCFRSVHDASNVSSTREPVPEAFWSTECGADGNNQDHVVDAAQNTEAVPTYCGD
jgi:glycosyltransferase involved in cell wall biosynthesis